jgi:hypothetical protein
MDLDYLPELICLFFLAWAYGKMWSQRRDFPSLLPLMVAVVLLFIARLTDVFMQLPASFLSGSLQQFRMNSQALVNGLSDVSDTLGVLSLVIGFVAAIRFQKAEERRIRNLEVLLPLCSSCKKYRTKEGVWKPIEQYILESGGPQPTHGFCPECAGRMKDEMKRLKRAEGKGF